MSNTLRFTSIDQLPPHLRELARARLADGTPVPRQIAPAAAVAPTPIQRHTDGERNPSEHDEQVRLFEEIRKLADVAAHYALAADRTFAIPNGGGRTKREGGRLKAEGVRPGVADVFVALPVGMLHGLFIELKSLTGDPSREQRHWLNQSTDLGYGAACCRGWQQALLVWTNYVDGAQ